MVERGIKFEMIEDAINFPNYIIRKGKKVEAFKNFNEGVLKIVYLEKENFIKIITLFWK